RYILREEGSVDILDADKDRVIDLSAYRANEITLVDTWNPEGSIENAFYTKPFQQVLLPSPGKVPKLKTSKFFTHEFKVKAPLLNADEWICITGTGKMFKNWDLKKLLPLKQSGGWVTIKLNLSKEDFPLKYKYGIYNTKNKTFIYEAGSDRILQSEPVKKHAIILHDGFVHVQRSWKGAGVAIPVFSLRSNKGFGSGEFNDIKLLVDWAKQTGLKLLQFLPVNDTTATHSEKDSYPYAAISAFALHPMYINLDAVAGGQHSSVIRSLNKKKKSLDQQPDLDYESVIKFKLSSLKELYKAKKDSFLKDINYFDFFDLNREWLVPYAAYCFLRDKYQTADFTKWRSHKVYNEDAIQKLVSPSQPHYDEICFHYFIQYHLHLQLKEATEYAHKKGIILKGDIPIGVSRISCDVWVDPSLYNVNEQAGAPPDDFAVKGQNWGFPTYNWKKMQEDDYAWWRNRFAQMNNYFDSFRIDHILGFFRIWSIPIHAVEGILGRFVPAIPVHITDFHKNRIWFDHTRYCKPFIIESILEEKFGDNTPGIKKIFLDLKENGSYQLKEVFDTQRKIESYFEDEVTEIDAELKQGLFDLLSNVILIEEGSQPDSNPEQQFHFRISMQQTSSFQQLDSVTREQLSKLYVEYFFNRQDTLWKKEAMQKLPALKRSTNMLICGEDLGMVPHCVPEVMTQTGILSLEIQRMPKDPSKDFFHPKDAPYLSVVTPSTHDMSTIREWWEEDKALTQKFYNYVMGSYGKAPDTCEPSISKAIILQHVYSPAMWSIFQVQDLLGMSEKLRREDPYQERINQPSDPNHFWKYRMHLPLEALIKQKDFNKELNTMITESGRA
ncbi:MAG TPA: 4-alpha-glucanotransferase, partial [Flavitalea sp.]|nr:4-alpha-glucanotransferase [Flavitalea sp.]